MQFQKALPNALRSRNFVDAGAHRSNCCADSASSATNNRRNATLSQQRCLCFKHLRLSDGRPCLLLKQFHRKPSRFRRLPNRELHLVVR